MTPPAHLDPAKVPESKKLKASNPEMGAIHDFVAWMREKGLEFHQEIQTGQHGGRTDRVRNVETHIYEFFDIDPNKLEEDP
jgi:hypothetical protein